MKYPLSIYVGLEGPDITKAELEDGLTTTDPKYKAACDMEAKLKAYIEAFPDFKIEYADVEVSWEDIEGT